jgi:hypothetical protein
MRKFVVHKYYESVPVEAETYTVTALEFLFWVGDNIVYRAARAEVESITEE